MQKGSAYPYLDSLYQVYNELPSSQPKYYKERITLLNAISDYEIHENPLNALPLIDTLAHLYQLVGDDAMHYRERYRRKGFLYATAHHRLKALESYQKYVKYCKKESTDDAYFLLDIGNIYYEFTLYNMAKIYYQEAETIFERHQFYRGLGTIYSNYSLIAQKQNQIDSALFYIEKTLQVQENDTEDRDLLQVAHTYQVLGRIYSEKLKNYPIAIQYYQKSLTIFRDRSLHKNPNRYNQIIAYWPSTTMHLGKAYYANNQFDSATYCIENAMQIVNDLDKDHIYTFIAVNIAEMYMQQKKLEAAQVLLLNVEDIAIKIGDKTSLEHCYKLFKQLHEEKEEYKKVIHYAHLYETLRDSIQKEQDAFFMTTDGLLKHEKNERIAQQEQIIRSEKTVRQGLYVILFLTGVILMISLFLGAELHRKNKDIERYANDLKANNKIKEIILSVIGHDLRSPFGVITNISGLLQKNLKEKNYKALNKLTDLLYDSSKKAYSMVDELMQWTTLQKSTPVVKRETVDVRTVIQETIHQLGTLLEQGNIAIKVNVAAIHCWTDPALMQIILRNILTNAIKYTPYGGAIIIQTKWEEGAYVLQIEDGGAGIDAALLKRIFSAKNSLEVVKDASGLGLVIVLDLCKKIDWDIRVFNKKGSGAVFELSNLILSEEPILNKPTVEQQEASVHVLTLSNANKLILAPYLQALLTCEVYEATKVRKIIRQIEVENEEIANWLKRLEMIINQHDIQNYQSFLKGST